VFVPRAAQAGVGGQQMRIGYISSALISMSLLAAAQIASADEWGDADRKIRRVDSAEFRQLPIEIIQELKKRGCTIPQSYVSEKLHNVINGEFAKKGQKDWAVLCSRDHSSFVLIFWGGDRPCPSEILQSKDRGWLQGTGDGIGYSRVISTVGKNFIDSHFEAYGGPIPPTILHEGINEAFIEKASTVHYCHNGKWLELTGAD
jgi:hypothetical protein